MTTAAAKPSRPPRKPPGPSEVVAIDVARRRVADRPARLTVAIDAADGGKIQSIGPDHSDLEGWTDRLQDAFATRGSAFAVSQLNHLIAVARDADGTCDVGKVNAMLALIEGAKPTNEVEAVLAVQLAVTHELALQAARRALRVDTLAQYSNSAGMAVKLLRTVAMQVEALSKLQRGGEQVVKVVHVHPGAQAVIGTVNATGGRGSEENEYPTPCKGSARRPQRCADAGSVERERGAGRHAGRRPWRVSCGAGCMAAPWAVGRLGARPMEPTAAVSSLARRWRRGASLQGGCGW